MAPLQLILASQSPRRRELLATAGFSFTVRVSAVEEVRAPGESPDGYAQRLAREKAEAVWRTTRQESGTVVLGADTIVVLSGALGGTVLEKPRDAQDARAMLRKLSGRDHTVITAICLRHAQGAESASESTRVWFAKLSAGEIDAYVASGEPMDKAGAYGIQGLASKFIDRIDGSYTNVVGLPLSLLYRYLREND
jgi:septum formation protein